MRRRRIPEADVLREPTASWFLRTSCGGFLVPVAVQQLENLIGLAHDKEVFIPVHIFDDEPVHPAPIEHARSPWCQ